MLKKKLGIEAIERDWSWLGGLVDYFKISPILIIPESVEVIRFKAFSYCWYLKKVEILGSMKIIGGAAFRGCENLEEVEIPEGCEYMGRYSFCGCSKLERVVIPKSVKRIENYAFAWCRNAVIILKKHKKDFEEIEEDAFRECKDVKEEVRD